MWRIGWAHNNARKWQMGFNSAFRGLIINWDNVQRKGRVCSKVVGSEFKRKCSAKSWIKSVSKTPNGFWNWKTSVFAKRRFHTDLQYSYVQWCLEFSWDGALVRATPYCGRGIVYQNSLLQLNSLVSESSFKDVRVPATIIYYYGYRNGVKMDQRRTVNHKDVHCWLAHLTVWSG